MDNLENRVGERRLLRFSDGKMNWRVRRDSNLRPMEISPVSFPLFFEFTGLEEEIDASLRLVHLTI